MQQRLAIGRQVGVDHEVEVRQIEAARGDVGGDADPGAAVAQRLQGVGALVLAQLAGQRHRREAALQQAGVQVAHRLARGAEHQGAARLEEAQHIDDGVLDLVRRDADGAVFDVAVRLVLRHRVDAHGVLLVVPGQR